MAKEFSDDDAALLKELGVEEESSAVRTYSAKEERILAGFEDIQRFVQDNDRLPDHADDRDIFERLYAVRLDRILASDEYLGFLQAFDATGILSARTREAIKEATDTEDLSDAELLEALGVDGDQESDITKLTHVRSAKEKRKAEEVGQRSVCPNFDEFKPIFVQVQKELDGGLRRTIKYKDAAEYQVGDLFIVGGQKVLVAAMSEEFVTQYDRTDRKLQAVYDNGTESNFLFRSLQRALNRDSASRRILPPDSEAFPLFSSVSQEGDVETGHIYVVRSLSEDSFISENRELIHKIGMTTGDVGQRLSAARKDPTYLLADVELVADYSLSNLAPRALERLLHAFFSDARLDVKLRDRFGEKVEPREWFLLPLGVIQNTIELLLEGRLEGCRYDVESCQIVDSETGKPVKSEKTS